MASGTSPNKSNDRGKWIDPATLMRIKNLQIRARVVVEGYYTGLHRSPYHGFSSEFSEYRQYTPGDDPRYIDWKLYARSDRHFIKRFEDETNLRCYLLVDRSGSMGFGSGEYTKSDYATTLAATFAYYLSKQRDAVGLLTFDQTVGEYIPAKYRPGHFNQILGGLERPLAGTDTDLIGPLKHISEITRKRSLIVMVSDLLAEIDGLKQGLGFLRAAGHDVVVFQTLDPAEIDFSFEDASIFEDLESGKKIYVDPSSAKTQYKDKLKDHLDSITSYCNESGIDLHRFSTDRPLELGLFDFIQSRLRKTSAAGSRQVNLGGAK